MTPDQRATLQSIARSQTAPHREVRRARALLAAADGTANARIASSAGVSPTTVRAWRRQFETDGLTGWGTVRPGRGRKHSIPDATIAEIIELTSSARPDGRRWSARTLAAQVGVSRSTVHRVWTSLGLSPDEAEGTTADPLLDSVLGDVAGVYVNPPRQAVVVYAKEGGRRLQGRGGRPESATVDGSGSPMAAPAWLDDEVEALTSAMHGRRTDGEGHQLLLRFLEETDDNVPRSMQVHLVMDGSGDHEHPEVLAWLSRRPRFHVHVVPQSSTWLGQMERRVRHVADRRLRRGRPDEDAPYVWVSTADRVLSRVRRRRRRARRRNPTANKETH
jgi:transposase